MSWKERWEPGSWCEAMVECRSSRLLKTRNCKSQPCRGIFPLMGYALWTICGTLLSRCSYSRNGRHRLADEISVPNSVSLEDASGPSCMPQVRKASSWRASGLRAGKYYLAGATSVAKTQDGDGVEAAESCKGTHALSSKVHVRRSKWPKKAYGDRSHVLM